MQKNIYQGTGEKIMLSLLGEMWIHYLQMNPLVAFNRCLRCTYILKPAVLTGQVFFFDCNNVVNVVLQAALGYLSLDVPEHLLVACLPIKGAGLFLSHSQSHDGPEMRS